MNSVMAGVAEDFPLAGGLKDSPLTAVNKWFRLLTLVMALGLLESGLAGLHLISSDLRWGVPAMLAE